MDIEALRRVPLFAALETDVLRDLAPYVSEQRFARGTRILSAGSYCDGAYYLLEGEIRISFAGQDALPAAPPRARSRTIGDRARSLFGGKPNRAAGGPRPLEESPVDVGPEQSISLSAGDVFGEGSALTRFPIATDIDSVTDVVALLVRTAALKTMFDVEALAPLKAQFDARYRERTLRAHLKRVDIFQGVDPQVLLEVEAGAELLTFKPGKVIAAENQPSDSLLLVRAGYVQVATKIGDTTLTASYLRRGDWVGESGLLLGEPWPFSLVAVEHVELVKISRELLGKALRSRPANEGLLWRGMTAKLKEVAARRTRPIDAEVLHFSMESGLIHGESVLLIDLETCTRCDECVRACADAHEGNPKFVREGVRFRNFSVPTACFQCTDPVCMIGCPTGAITRPLGTFEVAIDPQTCIGCGNCVKRCPWGNIHSIPYDSPRGDRIDLATKCDLCLGRADGPACVQMCPQGSAVRINFKELDRVNELFSR